MNDNSSMNINTLNYKTAFREQSAYLGMLTQFNPALSSLISVLPDTLPLDLHSVTVVEHILSSVTITTAESWAHTTGDTPGGNTAMVFMREF